MMPTMLLNMASWMSEIILKFGLSVKNIMINDCGVSCSNSQITEGQTGSFLVISQCVGSGEGAH